MAEHSYQLYMRRGPMPGELFVLTAPTLIIGRDPLADILIRDPEVSRNHARLVRSEQGYEIQDMGSTNGTFIEDAPLRGEPHALRPGETVTLGSNVILEYQQMEMSTDDPLATMVAYDGYDDIDGAVDAEPRMTPDRAPLPVTGSLAEADVPKKPAAFNFLDDDPALDEGLYQDEAFYQASSGREALPQTGALEPSGHAFPPPHGGSSSRQPSAPPPEPPKKGNTLLTILLIVLILLVALCCFFAVLTLYFLQDAGLIGWGTQVLSTAV